MARLSAIFRCASKCIAGIFSGCFCPECVFCCVVCFSFFPPPPHPPQLPPPLYPPRPPLPPLSVATTTSAPLALPPHASQTQPPAAQKTSRFHGSAHLTHLGASAAPTLPGLPTTRSQTSIAGLLALARTTAPLTTSCLEMSVSPPLRSFFFSPSCLFILLPLFCFTLLSSRLLTKLPPPSHYHIIYFLLFSFLLLIGFCAGQSNVSRRFILACLFTLFPVSLHNSLHPPPPPPPIFPLSY